MGNVSCIGNNCVIDAVDSLSVTASTAFDAFTGGIVPLIIGALALLATFKIGRGIIRLIRLV